MTQRTDPMPIFEWLVNLGLLCTTPGSATEAEAKLSLYADELAEEFTPDRFTPETLRIVSKRCDFFPSYGKLQEYVRSAWYDTAAGRAQTASLKAQCEAIAAKARGDWDTPKLERQAQAMIDGTIADTVRAIAAKARLR